MRLVLVIVPLVLCGLALVACPAPKVPKGPPPEYEDPPAPSWVEGGAPALPAPPPSAADAGAPPQG